MHMTGSLRFCRATRLPLFLLILGASPALAVADCIEYENFAHWVGWHSVALATDVAISGSYAYVPYLDYAVEGLRIVDISDPASPKTAGDVLFTAGTGPVAVSGTRAFVVGLDLKVIDVSNPGSPAVVGSLELPGYQSDIAISGSYAFIANGDSGLKVVDITLDSPVIVGSVRTPSRANRVVVSGYHAYVTDDSTGLQVIDVSNPTSPAIVGTVGNPGSSYALAVDGTYVYLPYYVKDDSRLQVIDVSDPNSPQVVGLVSLAEMPTAITVSGSRAYVLEFDSPGAPLLQVIDVSVPASPVVLRNIETRPGAPEYPNIPVAIEVSGAFAYIALAGSQTRSFDSGLQVIDVANPSSPEMVGQVDTPGKATALVISGDYTYVADDTSGLQIVDISNPNASEIVGGVATQGRAQAIAVSGSYAYAGTSDWPYAFQVIDVSNPTSPTVVGTLGIPDAAAGVAVSGSYAYVAVGLSGLQVIDISNPASPTIVGSVDTPSLAVAVAVSGSFAYVAVAFCWAELPSACGLEVIDISNPASPVTVNSYEYIGGVRGLAISGAYLYLAVSSDLAWPTFVSIPYLAVLDTSNPASPVGMGGVALPDGVTGVAVSGSYAYVSARSGLQVIDISDPEYPRIMGSADTPAPALGVAVSGFHAYVADGTSGLVVLPVQCSAPTPVVLSYLRASAQPAGILLEWGTASEMDLVGFHVYRNSGRNGEYELLTAEPVRSRAVYRYLDVDTAPGHTYSYRLEALDRAGGREFFGPITVQMGTRVIRSALGPAVPNPSASGNTIRFTVAEQGPVTLRILDVAGREMRLLVDEILVAGDQSVFWDGRDGEGQVVPAGLYLYQLRSKGFEATGKLIRLR